MNAQSLVHVYDHKVIISRLGSREPSLVQLGRPLQNALQGGDIGLLVVGRDVAPSVCQLGYSGLESLNSPFPADLELVLSACRRLGNLGVDVGSALVLEIQHSIA